MKSKWDEVNVLIVEDNPSDLFIVKEFLKRTHFSRLTIDHADTIPTALQKLKTQHFDVILLDLSVGEIFGVETIQAFSPRNIDPPVVVLTNLINDEMALEALKLGAQDYLVKGEYNQHLLEKTIRYAIERKRTQALLRESQEKYMLLFESNPVPMLAYELSTGNIIMVNEAAVRQYGYGRDEFIQINYSGLCASVRVDGQLEIGNGQYTHLRRDGSTFEAEVVSNPLSLNGIPAALLVVYDITDRIRAEAELRLWESIVIHSNDAVVVGLADPLSHSIAVKYVNPAFERMTGYKHEEVQGKNLVEIQNFATSPLLYETVVESIRNSNSLHLELLNRKKNGTTFWMDFNMFPVADSNGKVSHYVSFQRDITEKKELEEGIRKRLELQVEERTRELHKALNKEKELVELKNRFVAIASHEFRTPLSTIGFTTDFLAHHLQALSPEETSVKLGKIKKQVNHMTVLLEDVIMAGRSDVKKIPVVKSSIVLKPWLERLCDEVRNSTRNTHSIELDFDFEASTMETDEKLFRNILTNLLTNAIKFSPQRNSISLVVKDFSRSLEITVTDGGIGIPKNDHDILFEPFQRGRNTSGIQGTGLGLSIVKKAVELLEGRIEVTSELNVGTSVKVEIPF